MKSRIGWKNTYKYRRAGYVAGMCGSRLTLTKKTRIDSHDTSSTDFSASAKIWIVGMRLLRGLHGGEGSVISPESSEYILSGAPLQCRGFVVVGVSRIQGGDGSESTTRWWEVATIMRQWGCVAGRAVLYPGIGPLSVVITYTAYTCLGHPIRPILQQHDVSRANVSLARSQIFCMPLRPLSQYLLVVVVVVVALASGP